MDSPIPTTNFVQPLTHYSLTLEIFPAENFIKVSGNMNFFAANQTIHSLDLLLHRQIDIQILSGDQIADFSFDQLGTSPIPYLPDARPLHIRFIQPLVPGENAQIHFAYEGRITAWPSYSCNVITADWVELGMYFPWYPMLVDVSQKISFDLQVLCPPGWHVAGYGDFQVVNQTWKSQWTYPAQDIVVIASPSLHHRFFRYENGQINLFTSTFNGESSQLLGENSLLALSTFTKWFGPTLPEKFSIIQSPRKKGGGYGRRGLVVLGGINEVDFLNRPEVYLRYLGHEIAHAWWWAAPVDSWEDWLNEGMAEISAQLLVAERFGQEAYYRRMECKRTNAAGMGPLWGFERLDHSTPQQQERCERLLYDRGAVILHNLRNRVGGEHFLALCQRFRHVESLTTQSFLTLAQEMFGNSISQWLEDQLKAT